MRFLVLQHVPHEGPGRYAQFAKEAGIKLETVELKSGYEIPTPAQYKDFDAAIVMGGPQGVNDSLKDYPSRDDEVRFLQQFDKPTLCVCLGSQLLAHSKDARVYRGERKECGFYVVRLTPQGRRGIFRGFEDQIDVLHWHGDVFNVPEGAVPLALSKYDQSVQAYSIDGKVAMLFHLEMTPRGIDGLFEADRDWFKKRQDFLEYHGNTEAAVKEHAAELDGQMERNARRVFDNFVSMVEHQE
ncbi:MAG: type 1 glutamine amidotransferase [Candidatus Aenigmarchaeota archaeon]|nr:type 1 glutamine amidotransferase [Candidatus Aenigmarchaeota archaeon]